MDTFAPITTKELHLYHRVDREVFCFLIFRLHRDLTESLLVMTLWLWLENIGLPNPIHKVMGLPNALANALVDEAVTCLKFLEIDDPVIPSGSGLPLTKCLMQRDISLQIFHVKRYTAIAGIKSVLNNICARIFSDILQIIIKRNNISNASTSRAVISRASVLKMPLVVPGFPHPLFGSFDLSPRTMNPDLSDMSIWDGKRPSDYVTDDDKSLFLTFSKGFPVSENEVVQLFTYLYGDCVQSLSMGASDNVNQQSLFAIMVLKTVVAVDEILKGNRVEKLQINGKHIWARKYTRRY
ncbi:hypothetical protein SESBI_32057 [Sesbania bispinosa]|nr:hypothetical protein SESBI_32057 [Sesbania bispinosa]